MKRILCLSLVLTMLCALLTFMPVNAATIVDSGNCGAQGDNVKWTLDSEGTLTISGTGEMADYFSPSQRPWGLGVSVKAGVWVKTVIVKSGITYIGSYTFSGINSLQNAIIEYGILKIGNGAFWSSGLVDIKIFEGVTEIGDDAFSKCNNLKEVHLPDSTVTIGKNSFMLDSNLIKVNIPNNTKTIGEGAFYGTGITSVKVPSGVTSIGFGAFRECEFLPNIDVESGNLTYSSDNGVLFDKYKSKLLQYPTGKKESEYTIPNSVEEIDVTAFEKCNLSNVVIPQNVKRINQYAFYSCKNLQSIKIFNGVESIGDYAFSESALKEVNIPDSVIELGSQTFYMCKDLERIFLGKGITVIPWSIFNSCSKLGSIIIPEGVTEIGEYAFCNCENLCEITIPKSVNKVMGAAFSYCRNLSDVYYEGTKQDWEKIEINMYEGFDGGDMYVSNKPLLNATIHYNSPMPGEVTPTPDPTPTPKPTPTQKPIPTQRPTSIPTAKPTADPNAPSVEITEVLDYIVTAKVNNCDDFDAQVILAVYNKNGALIEMQNYYNFGEVMFFSENLQNANIKVMLWSDMNGMKPLAEIAEMSL